MGLAFTLLICKSNCIHQNEHESSTFAESTLTGVIHIQCSLIPRRSFQHLAILKSIIFKCPRHKKANCSSWWFILNSHPRRNRCLFVWKQRISPGKTNATTKASFFSQRIFERSPPWVKTSKLRQPKRCLEVSRRYIFTFDWAAPPVILWSWHSPHPRRKIVWIV